MTDTVLNRRKILTQGGLVLAASAASGPLWAHQDAGKPVEEISPPEDLMREHGVLNRILLIYEEVLRRMDAKDDLPPEPLKRSAQIVRDFVEDYHEKLEEDYLFPRFRKANTLVDLVSVLSEQHRIRKARSSPGSAPKPGHLRQGLPSRRWSCVAVKRQIAAA